MQLIGKMQYSYANLFKECYIMYAHCKLLKPAELILQVRSVEMDCINTEWSSDWNAF